MSAHTPGPWKWSSSVNGHCILVGADGTPIARVVALDGTDADDDLIIGAPGLYAALRSLLDTVTDIRGIDMDAYARAEIAAAESALAKVQP